MFNLRPVSAGKLTCSKEIIVTVTAAKIKRINTHDNYHCVKSVRIRSYSGPQFPTFGLNTGRYSVSLRI